MASFIRTIIACPEANGLVAVFMLFKIEKNIGLDGYGIR